MNNLKFDRVIGLAAKDTKKGARVAAKVFYRILRKKGFSENQIIDIATNIIDCLTVSLKGYKKKIENIKEKDEQPHKEITPGKEKVAMAFAKYRRKNVSYDGIDYSSHM